MQKEQEKPTLLMIQGVNPGGMWKLDPGRANTIGRSSRNAVSLRSPTVSRFHSEIIYDQGNWYLSDLNSHNGTFLNMIEVDEREELKSGDTIRICENIMLFSDPVQQDASKAEQQTVGDATMGLSHDKDIALFLVDMVRSSKIILEKGNTVFTDFVAEMKKVIVGSSSANKPVFLKCTGDGFLAMYNHIPQALSTALATVRQAPSMGISVRTALHWGTVRIGDEGEPLGVEMHRIFRIEGVEEKDRDTSSSDMTISLPAAQRILATRPAISKLPEEEKDKFVFVGEFRLEGFQDLCDLWLYQQEN